MTQIGNRAEQVISPKADMLSLQNFQQQLSDRIQAAQSNASAEQLYLHAKVGGHSMLLALPDTSEVIPVGQVMAIPLTQQWLLGLANIRGELKSVIDLAAWLGWGKTQLSATSRWVLLAPTLGVPGLIVVDQVIGLVNLQTLQHQAQAIEPRLITENNIWISHMYDNQRYRGIFGAAFALSADLLACQCSLGALIHHPDFKNPERRQVSL